MLSSIGYALGAGSGIDTAALIRDLTEAARAGKDKALAARTEKNTAKVSALGSLTSGIDNLSSSLATLISGGTLLSQPTSSNASLVSVKAATGGRIGGLTTTITVAQLAQAQSVMSAKIPSATDPIGSGTMRLVKANGTTLTIGTAGQPMSLNDLAAAINRTSVGVTATVLKDSTGFRLSVRGPQGADAGFTLEAGADADAGLADYAFPTGTQFTQLSSPQDARITLDGVEFTRSSNGFSDLVPGIAFDLRRASPGETVTIGGERASTNVRQAVLDLVAAYNELDGVIDEGTARETGPLNGDSGVRAMQQALARLVTTTLASGGTVTNLADLGVKTMRDGSLTVDTARLDAVLAADPDAVEALFNPVGTDKGIGGALKALRDDLRGLNGALTATTGKLSKEAAAISAEKVKVETRSQIYNAQLVRQYSAMEVRVASFKATQSYLEQQIKMWSADR